MKKWGEGKAEGEGGGAPSYRRTSLGQTIPALLNSSLGQKDVEITLVDLGTLFVEKFLVVIPTLMMAWSNKPENSSEARQGNR